MYSIVHERGDRRWVSGFFQTKDKTIEYLDSIPVDLNPRLIELAIDSYPVYLLEIKGMDFIFYKDTEFDKYIQSLTIQDDDDFWYGNVYSIGEDWQSPRAGTDYMGAIRHKHLFNREIATIRNSGIANYFAR